MRIAIYPGSFDPLTLGHLDIVERSARLFDRVIMAIITNPAKEPLFTLAERREMIEKIVVKRLANVQVDVHEGLLMDYAKRKKANVLVRGIRALADYEYELQMALMNRRLAPQIDTVLMMPAQEYCYLSSSLVKEVAGLGASVSGLVPPEVEKRLIRRFRKP